MLLGLSPAQWPRLPNSSKQTLVPYEEARDWQLRLVGIFVRSAHAFIIMIHLLTNRTLTLDLHIRTSFSSVALQLHVNPLVHESMLATSDEAGQVRHMHSYKYTCIKWSHAYIQTNTYIHTLVHTFIHIYLFIYMRSQQMACTREQ